jgi:prevent-host-death family protein
MTLPTWPAQDAKARFSELLDTCLAQGPQMVTKRGVEAAVLVPVTQWRRMQTVVRPSLKTLLMSDEGRGELVLPERGTDPSRRGLPQPFSFQKCLTN